MEITNGVETKGGKMESDLSLRVGRRVLYADDILFFIE